MNMMLSIPSTISRIVRVNKATQASGLLIHSIEARLVEMSRRAKAMWWLACFLSCVETLDGPIESLGLLGRPTTWQSPLRPFPFPEPDRLAVVWSQFSTMGLNECPSSWPEYADFRE